MNRDTYDAAVIGAGVAGCVAALACARRGQRVLLLEQDPLASTDRCVGEWLHPPALDVLDRLGVDLAPPMPYPTGKGFALLPDDGGEPIVLPYRAGRSGFAIEHALLVELLRGHVARHESIEYLPHARAVRLEGDALTFERRHASTVRTVRAERVIGATGEGPRPIARGDVLTFATGELRPSHRVAALTLHGVELPFEGHLHVAVGGPGPAMVYRLGPSQVRVLLDVPLSAPIPREGGVALFEAFASAFPDALIEPFRAASMRPPAWSHGALRPRASLARDGVLWIGDAAGSVHPLTAIDLGLAILDGDAVATATSARAYARARRSSTRAQESIAVGLHELFADASPETVALRRAAYRLWRERPRERLRTMGFLAGDGEGALPLFASSLRVMARGALEVLAEGARAGSAHHAANVSGALVRRIGLMVGGSLGITDALPPSVEERLGLRDAPRYGGAIHSDASAEVVGLPHEQPSARARIERALARGTEALIAQQADDGSWEGEVVWCAMLAAQYVLACHVMGIPIDPDRKRRLLLHFRTTRLPSGTWGLHEKSEPYLFVTILVYVAARLLGLAKDDPLLAPAHAFLRAEGGAVGIPSWGKLWLALVGLYEWEGVSPVVPELWHAPRWLPVHPARYYCHTRLIYLGMATLYAERHQRAPTPTIRALRDELFLVPYEEVDFRAARETVREGDVHVPTSPALRWTYRALALFDSTRTRASREGVLAELRERIRYELRSTAHTCISPVSGLLDILALWIADPHDPDVVKALERFEGWIWEDDEEGLRVAGARSATWDTSFALQALSTVAPFVDVREALERGDAFLRSQQIRAATGRESENDRLDPTGGYCFAGVWHGWPVSDCTAEAMLARLESPSARPSTRELTEAARFVLRTQNSDGGFGSYEARRVDLPIEWLNPSEMFGACMTERSYVECTASCVAALAAFRARHPEILRAEIDASIARAVSLLRRTQRPDGSWPGVWGVSFVYGTLFGVRGLIAGGVSRVDPQVRRACAWLKERQRADGGWGEHFSSVLEQRYVEHEEGQVVQTAWALSALLDAHDPDFVAIERGASFLARMQREDGTWPKQDPEGIFFHTALLEYRLYRSYFPVWALGLYAQRAKARATRTDGAKPMRVIEPRSLH